MTDIILTTLISSAATLIGTIITVIVSYNKTNNKIMINQAITDTKLEALTEEVKSHNDFARRIPVIEEKLKVSDHRLTDLENYMKGA